MAIAKQLLSLALAVLGVVLLGVGVWFSTHLGSSGAATFRWSPSDTRPVLLEPSLLNRVDKPLTVTVRPAQGDSVWVGLAAPSDVDAAIGRSSAARLTRVAVRDWAIRAERTGTGEPAAIAGAEIWRSRSTNPGAVTIPVDQRAAPETIVVHGEQAPLRSVTVTWRDQTWFVESVLLGFVGLLLAVAGLGALVAGRRSGRRSTS